MFSKIMMRPLGARLIRPQAFARANALQSHQIMAQRFQIRTKVYSSFDWNPVKSKEEKPKPSIFRSFLFILLLAMPVVSFYLGTWQLRRLKWKNNLIATSEDRLTYEPIPLPKHVEPQDVEDLQYRKYYVTGHYDHSREVFVGPKVKFGEKGYSVFTPFIRSDGGDTILIERGFVKDDKILPPRRKLQHLSLPMHEVRVELILKKTAEDRSALLYDKLDEESRVWHVINVDEMTEATGCAPIHAQALIDLKDHPIETITVKESKPWWKIWRKAHTHEETILKSLPYNHLQEFTQWQLINAGVPVGRPASIDLRNNHLQYLVTWYGLSFASSIALFVMFKKKPKVDPTKAKLEHAKRFQ
ncbi:putative membrane protein [Wickerhamomyces ciferrii]|uniref:SURF1-like protein n=1 Tax=Wickerhamomyces ciferrii (strain ATCC 14091 / BCRC 22168 / CBS 111 / JCM 3599 / NBRC 0793 / NRRL Y-1031 F-60-10) TaxID=1206466 RepID=K0KIE9_WICCF|nr:uncharacterized protein BN7_711 [Wickerhamomyces ciferrii]CCH41174.1 putative membrane protein [Wickerhamomyces ciferrii]